MDAGRVAEACEKFAASQQLDPALGTLLYLADCYDRAGRTASAWALFREVQERSRRAAQPDREQIALERASALEAKLSRLELRVPRAHQLPGLELSLGQAAVPKASWNAGLPVDPGTVLVEARAPGRKPWSVRIRVAAGPSQQVVELPRLAPAPVVKTSTTALPERRAGSPLSAVGLVTGSVGLVALAAGGFLGYRAYSLNKRSKGECRADSPNDCTPEGVSLREQSGNAAQLSTVVTVGGGLLVAAGITLIVAAPSPRADTRGATASDGDWRLALRGVW